MKNINIKDYAEELREEKPDWSTDGQILTVYRIPLDKLYYNDDNGRIATWISDEYINNSDKLKSMNMKEKNDLIHDFIKKSNSKESFEKTKKDIKFKGQNRPGVVLSDGRVVSGNRRFTCLRELYKENQVDKYGYFECFIIEKKLENEWEREQIKTIERLTQFGVDEKVDYDPIARLVDIYNDLIGPRKIWTIEEYTKKLSLKKTDVELMCSKAKIMVDYLNYIEKPNHFYIARAKKLDGPLQELARLYNKVPKSEWNTIRNVFYSQLSEKGDTTRDIRNLIRLYKEDKNEFNKLLSKINDDIDSKERENFETMNKTEIIDSDKLNMLEEDISNFIDSKKDEVKSILSETSKKDIFDTIYRVKIKSQNNGKIKKVHDSLDNLINLLADAVEVMNEKDKRLLIKKINQFNAQISLVFKE